MEQVKLAIVIPAYKAEFLDEALESLACQTNGGFHVYVGDDCSPNDLAAIVSRYQDKLALRYQRFPENKGKSDLIAHWNRCLEMMEGEEYFCLFSDDDRMGTSCVEMFYQTLEHASADVYHFNLSIINERGSLLCQCPDYPELLSSAAFFRSLYTYRIDARMPEFIFNTRHFFQCGGFVPFDLAFRSDNATVMVCASDKGIRTIPIARVFWRDSGTNLSSERNVPLENIRRKAEATIDFCNWARAFFARNGQPYPLPLSKERRLALRDVKRMYPACSWRETAALLHALDCLKSSRLLFLYYWVDLWLYVKKKRKVLRRKE